MAGASEQGEQGQRLLPNFWVGASVLSGCLSMWQTDGDDYLQMEVTGDRAYASFIIVSWSRRFVIQIYLSTPRITFISIDLLPNDLKRMDLFLARRCICPPRTHCTQGLQNITQKWPTSVFLAGVLRQNYCRVTYLLLHMDVHSCC